MQVGSPIGQRWDLMREHLDERQRRTFAAAEAKVIGRGGVSTAPTRPAGAWTPPPFDQPPARSRRLDLRLPHVAGMPHAEVANEGPHRKSE